jgi:hypothetical protein
VSAPITAAPVGITVVAIALLADLAGTVSVLRGGRWWRRLAVLGMLTALALPAAVVGAVRFGVDGTRPGYAAATVVGAATALALLSLVTWRVRPAAPALVVVALSWLASLLDVATAGSDTAFRLLGWRGVMPTAIAGTVAAATALTVGAGLWGWPRRERVARRGGFGSTWTRPRDGWLAAAGVVVAVTLGLLVARRSVTGGPILVAAVPASILLMIELAGWRVAWRRLGVLVGAVATVVGVVALIQLTDRPDEQAPLGSSARRVLDGDSWPDLSERFEVAGDPGGAAAWVLLLPAGAVVLALLATPRRGVGRDVIDHVPGASALLHAGNVLVLLGWAAGGLGLAAAVALVAVPWALGLVLVHVRPVLRD